MSEYNRRLRRIEAISGAQQTPQEKKVFPTDFSALRARLDALKPWYRERYLDPAEIKSMSIPQQDKLAKIRMDIESLLTVEERSQLSFKGQVRLSEKRGAASETRMRELLAKLTRGTAT